MAPVQKWKILIAAGRDPNINVRSLEFTWYGLWGYTLRCFESVRYCFVFPQKELSASILDVGDRSYEDDGKNSDFDAEELEVTAAEIDELSQEIFSLNVLVQTASPNTENTTFVPSTPPKFNLANEGQITFSGPPLASSPILHRLRKRKRSSSPSTLVSSNSLDAVAHNTGINITGSPHSVTSLSKDSKPKRKIPDFAILYLPCGDDQDENTPVEEIKFAHKIIPIIAKVKRWEPVTDGARSLQIEFAIQELLEQIGFLFSSDPYQSAVIAIAATGDLWCWATFKRVNFNLLDSVSNWSGIYRIGTADSDEMLRKINVWVNEFVIDPSSTDLNDIVDVAQPAAQPPAPPIPPVHE